MPPLDYPLGPSAHHCCSRLRPSPPHHVVHKRTRARTRTCCSTVCLREPPPNHSCGGERWISRPATNQSLALSRSPSRTHHWTDRGRASPPPPPSQQHTHTHAHRRGAPVRSPFRCSRPPHQKSVPFSVSRAPHTSGGCLLLLTSSRAPAHTHIHTHFTLHYLFIFVFVTS